MSRICNPNSLLAALFFAGVIASCGAVRAAPAEFGGMSNIAISVGCDLDRPIGRYITGAGFAHLHTALREDLFAAAPGGKNLDQLLAEMGITMIRFPHGGYGQRFFWNNDDWTFEAQAAKGWDSVNRTRPYWWHVDEFIAFCRRHKIEPLLEVNTRTVYDPDLKRPRKYDQVSDGGTQYDKAPTPEVLRSLRMMARYAAEFVRYVNIEKKYRVRYWEIGNEDWGSAYLYRIIVEEFTKEMRAVDPSIRLLAAINEPGYAELGKSQGKWKHGGADDWQMQARLYAPTVDYLAVHRYWSGIESIPTAEVMQGAIGGGWENNQVRPILALAPVALTEWNTAGGNTNSIRHTHTDALLATSQLNGLVRDGVQIGVVHDLVSYKWGLLWYHWNSGERFAYAPSVKNAQLVWSKTPMAWAFALFNEHRGTRLISYGETGRACNYTLQRRGDEVFLIYVNGQPQPALVTLDLRRIGHVNGQIAVTSLTGKVLLGDEFEKWFVAGQRRELEREAEMMSACPEMVERKTLSADAQGLVHFELPAWAVGYLKIPVRFTTPAEMEN